MIEAVTDFARRETPSYIFGGEVMELQETYNNGARAMYLLKWRGRSIRFPCVVSQNPKEQRSNLAEMLCKTRARVQKEFKAHEANSLIRRLRHYWNEQSVKPMPVLELIESKGAVSFMLSRDGRHLSVGECCDNYYDVDLTKQEAQEMIDCLQRLVDQMPTEQ